MLLSSCERAFFLGGESRLKMFEPNHETGKITVLLNRLSTQRLPRLFGIKAKVDRGERIADIDLRYLRDILDTTLVCHVDWSKHPDLHGIIGGVINLYRDITSKALDNERN